MEKARIILSGKNVKELNSVCNQIIYVAKSAGANVKGPIPFPTKKIRITCRKNPSGQGNASWDRWEMRIHKRIVEINMSARSAKAIRDVMRVQIPEGINIEIAITR